MATNLQYISDFEATDAVFVNATNVFTDVYDVYQIHVLEAINSDQSDWFYMRFLDSSGNSITQAEYSYGYRNMRSYMGFANDYANSPTSFRVGYTYGGTINVSNSIITVYNPYESNSFTYVTYEASNYINGSTVAGIQGGASHKSAESLSGFQIYFTSSNAGQKLKGKVYGVK